jgi:hypothetical protein
MAKVSHEKPLNRRVVVKTRGFIVHKNYKGKRPYVQKWPKRRGSPKSPRVKVWIEHFSRWADWSKQPDPCAVATAKDLVPTTGYWTRDVIHRAGSGKINNHRPKVPLSSPLPYLFLHPPSKRYEGPPKVITPTVKLRNSGSVPIASGGFHDVVPNAKSWDNNAFWDPATHPEIVTFRADGLYFFYANIQYTGGSNYGVHAHFEDQDGNWYGAVNGGANNGFEAWIGPIGFYYFYAGQTLKIRSVVGSSCSYNLKEWGVMAITPEGLL